MKTNRLSIFTLLGVIATSFMSCSSIMNSTVSDDMYSVHDRVAIANQQRARIEQEKIAEEQRKAALASKIAEAEVAAAESEFNGNQEPTITNIVADTYESAYTRRRLGFASPSYRLPSSYFRLSYSTEYRFASAYDPAFYNIMVSGNQVWVEPKYITSMFGTWGATVVVPYGWGYDPYSWYVRRGWYGPVYYPYPYGPYDPFWRPYRPYHPYYPHHYGPYYPRPYYDWRRVNIVDRTHSSTPPNQRGNSSSYGKWDTRKTPTYNRGNNSSYRGNNSSNRSDSYNSNNSSNRSYYSSPSHSSSGSSYSGGGSRSYGGGSGNARGR